jgi:hypothetical protein
VHQRRDREMMKHGKSRRSESSSFLICLTSHHQQQSSLSKRYFQALLTFALPLVRARKRAMDRLYTPGRDGNEQCRARFEESLLFM